MKVPNKMNIELYGPLSTIEERLLSKQNEVLSFLSEKFPEVEQEKECEHTYKTDHGKRCLRCGMLLYSPSPQIDMKNLLNELFELGEKYGETNSIIQMNKIYKRREEIIEQILTSAITKK